MIMIVTIPIEVTLVGIVTDVNVLHPSKAALPNDGNDDVTCDIKLLFLLR